MIGWKLSTFLLAGATLVLLGRDLRRQVPLAPRAQPRPEPVIAALPTPQEDGEPALPPPPPPPPAELPAAANEFAYTLLVWGPQRTWEERIALLEPRRDEVVPVLEDWIARSEEICAAGASLRDALIAYARLKGKDAVPVLERLHAEGTRARNDTVEALTWVENPDATQAILRIQERAPPESIVISVSSLLGRTRAAEDVLRAWEAVPAFRRDARRAFFLMGSPEDRGRVWESADREERLALMLKTKAWDSRFRDPAVQLIRSNDPWERLAGLNVILTHPEMFESTTVADAARALASDAISGPVDLRNSFERIQKDWDVRRKAEEKRERIRAVLLR